MRGSYIVPGGIRSTMTLAALPDRLRPRVGALQRCWPRRTRQSESPGCSERRRSPGSCKRAACRTCSSVAPACSTHSTGVSTLQYPDRIAVRRVDEHAVVVARPAGAEPAAELCAGQPCVDCHVAAVEHLRLLAELRRRPDQVVHRAELVRPEVVEAALLVAPPFGSADRRAAPSGRTGRSRPASPGCR